MISFLLVAISVVAGQKETVLDSRGNPVKANARYYILSPKEVRMAAITDKSFFDAISCPQRVVMSSEPLTVEPVIFELSSDVVRVSTELNIRFSRPSLCPGSRYWRVEDSSKAVVLNGSKSSNDSTFTIQKFGKSYKLAFGSADKPTDIGLERIRIEDYRLILSNNSGFAVSFAPAQF
ncbi:unnamed protein product [Brassica rapa]|uniref:Uncharacterized protein n=1 Tax=Brassica campestris TaxID=3711 RepID=A0A3P6B9N3_BRACM|nr:unnamed protein product [Brassica rapa]VDD01833.1 unnamed protein product [Brassica rapa]